MVCPDGFRFVRAMVGDKPKRHWHKTKRINAKGEPIQVCLLVWQANCAKCGAVFEVRVRWLDTAEKASAFNLRHCEAHRLTLPQITARAALAKRTKANPLRDEVLALLGAGHSVRAVALATGCPAPTVYRWKRVGQTPT